MSVTCESCDVHTCIFCTYVDNDTISSPLLGDAFLKTAITLIPEISELVEIDNKRQSSEPLLSVFVRNFLATLLVVPDNPDLGVVYLFGGLLNALKKYRWQPHSMAKVEVFSNALCYLSASCQEEYIYTIHNGTLVLTSLSHPHHLPPPTHTTVCTCVWQDLGRVIQFDWGKHWCITEW